MSCFQDFYKLSDFHTHNDKYIFYTQNIYELFMKSNKTRKNDISTYNIFN